MGKDVRIEFPEERSERHRKSWFKPLAWGVLIVAGVATFIGLQRLMEEGYVLTGSETASEANFKVQDNDDRGAAQPLRDDEAGRTTVVGSDEVPTSVPSEGVPVLPPGTSTVPTIPSAGAASSTAGGVVIVKGTTTGLMALIGDREPSKYQAAEVQVQGAYVQQIIGDRAFTIGPSSDEFLVVQFPAGTDKSRWTSLVQPGRIVSVSGRIQLMPNPESADRLFGAKGDPKYGGALVYIEAAEIGPKIE
jgi:hypothetical protein